MAKKAKKTGNPFPDIPDPLGYGQRAVDFLRLLKHPKSKLPCKAWQLDPWMERIVRGIYGPRDEHGNRIINDVTIMVPRGNRKTSLGAALALLHTLGPEAEPGGEVDFAAKDQVQAQVAFREVIGLIKALGILWQKGQGNRKFDSPNMVRLQEYLNRILFPNESFIDVLSGDGLSVHGRTPVFALCDEIHAWPKRDLWDAIDTGLTKTPNTLRVTITTAGRGQENLAYDIINHARKIARGEIDEPNHLVVLYEPEPDADWLDEGVWTAVNPGLAGKHGYPDIVRMRQRAKTAQQRPTDQRAFKQLYLNFWLDKSDDPFVDMSLYDEGNKPVDLATLKDRPCWLAVDLSTIRDLTAIVAAWRDGENYYVHPWFFCPEENLQRKADIDGVPYPLWAEQGYIAPTPGNTIDYNAVEYRIREICRTYRVSEIAFDPHRAHNTMQSLLDSGLPVVEMSQGWATMSPAIDELERAIVGRKLIHSGNPVLRWNFENVVVRKDNAGNRTFHKGKSEGVNSSRRIDGAVATAMAVARAATGDDSRSIYDDVSARPEGLLVF